jgi:signal peptidase I
MVAAAFGAAATIGVLASGLRPIQITSTSMAPSVDRGDWILVRSLDRDRTVRRGEIVMFRFPTGSSGRAIKRVVAVGGDRVTITPRSVSVNGRLIPVAGGPNVDAIRPRDVTVPAGHVFLLGDNTAVSNDSRNFGPVPAQELVARHVATVGSTRTLLLGALAIATLTGLAVVAIRS